MSLDSVLPARPGQVCPCGAPAVYGLLWRQPPGSRPALRHAMACARCAPPAVALDPLPPSTGPTRPPPVDLPSSSGEGEATERSAAPVEAQAEPPAVAVAGSEVGRGLPALEPLAAAGGQPISTPDPWDGPEGRAHSEPQEAPVARAAATLPPVDPVVPPGRCRLLGCATPSNVRGLCLPHYDLARRKGQLDELALPPIPRGRGTRFQRPAESAPSTRPQRAPRTRRAAAPRPETEALQAIWVALGSPDGLSPSEPLPLLRATGERLRVDAMLSSRIRELEEDWVRLRSQILQLRKENSRLETLKTSVLSSIPPTTLAFDGHNLDVLIRAALDAERWRVNDLRAALAEIVDQDLDGQTDAGLIAAATSEIQRLREGAVLALTVEELKVRAALLQESEKLRGWLVGDIAVSVRATGGDWRDIGGDWLFAAVTAVLQARADELERQALEGVSHG